MSHAVLYSATETNFKTMGLGPLRDAESRLITEGRNGVFELNMKYPITGELFNELQNNRIIKANAGHELKDQRFRIAKISKTFEENGEKYINVYGEHVSYLTRELAMKPEVYINGYSADVAIKTWKNALLDKSPFEVYSDILTTGTTSWHIRDVENPRMALGGVKGSLLDTYGGEYKFDNYKISLLKQRGKRANTIIKYGRNLISLEQEEYITSTYTTIFPYVIFDDDGVEKLITVDGYLVDSKHVDKYPNRKVLNVDFSSEFDTKDNRPTPAKILKLAEKYIKANDIGIPKVSIKLDYIDLSQTLDYKDLAVFEEVNLCDELPVYFAEMGIKTTAKVVRVVWNDIMDRYESIELGEPKTTLGTIINNIDKNVTEIKTAVNETQLAANGKNTIFRGPDKPTAKEVGDMWYQPVGDEVIFHIWNGQAWEEIFSTAGLTEVKKMAEEAATEAGAAKESADQAIKNADQAIKDAGFAKGTADQAKGIADSATSNAIKAAADAKAALDNYNNLAIGGRNYIILSRLGSYSPYNTTPTYEGNVVTTKYVSATANYFTISINQFTPEDAIYSLSGRMLINGEPIKKAQFINGRASTYNAKSAQNKMEVNDKGDFIFSEKYTGSNAWIFHTQIEGIKKDDVITIEKLKFEKGNKPTDWSPAPEDVQIQITNINGELSQKVSQTVFDKLQGTVATHGTQINQNKNDIALKANQTEVNAITGKVMAAESKLSIQAGQIAGLVTKTDGQTTDIAQLKLTAEGLSSTVSKVRTDLDGIEIGNTNRVFSSAFEDTKHFAVANGRIINKGFQGIRNSFKGIKDNSIAYKELLNQRLFHLETDVENRLENNQQYTLSFYAKASDSAILSTFIYPDRVSNFFEMIVNGVRQPGRSDGSANHNISSDWQKYTVVFKTNSAPSTTNATFLLFRMYTQGAEYEVSSIKLEKGNKATDWSPAPEDMATQVDFSNIQQTVQGIQTTVANKAEQSQVTQLAGQISSVVTDLNGINTDGSNVLAGTSNMENSRLRNWDFSIIRPVELGFYTFSFYAKASVKGNVSIYLNDDSGKGRIARTPHSKTVELSTTFQKFEFTFEVTKTTTEIDAIKMRVYSSGNSLMTITGHSAMLRKGKTASSWQPAPEEIANQSQITQLSNTINLKVSKGDLISQINIEAGRTLIQSNTIVLSSNTVIFTGSAFIPSAAIVSLKAEQITAGILNAANVNIINMNASNIVTGTLSAIAINGVTITGSDFLSISSQYGTRINQGRISFTDTSKGVFGWLGPVTVVNGLGLMMMNESNLITIHAGKWADPQYQYASMQLAPFKTGSLSTGVDFRLFTSSRFRIEFRNLLGELTKYIEFGRDRSYISLEKTTLFVTGNFSVSGSKNAIHVTRDGVRATPAYETAESYLGDIGEASTGKTCKIKIPIEDLFSDTVNTTIAYQVFLSKYSKANVWVSERSETYFVVESDKPNAQFTWEIKAKRKGYEADRLVLQQEIDNEKIEEIYGDAA